MIRRCGNPGAHPLILVRFDLTGILLALGVIEETSLMWLKRAARQADTINALLRRLGGKLQINVVFQEGKKELLV